MILILSEEKELSTSLVLEWLINWNLPFQRINKEWDIIDKIELSNDSINIFFQQGFSLKDISITWFRRGYLYFDIGSSIKDHPLALQHVVKKHLEEERTTLRNFVYDALREKDAINHPNHYNASKLITLQKAVKHGLLIPNTFVSNKKEDLVDFYAQENNKIITKNIQDVLTAVVDNERIGTNTNEVTKENINSSNAFFFYSLFQKAIPKKYELRVFYFKGAFFSAAIFSQLSIVSSVDSRTPDHSKPTRVIPYQLPQHIELKLAALLEELNLESGSIDLIVDHKGDYYFLEVNPVGQYDYISKSCNYHLDYHVATHLKQQYEKAVCL